MTTRSNIVVKRVHRAGNQPVVHIGTTGMSLTPISAKGKNQQFSCVDIAKTLSRRSFLCLDIRKRCLEEWPCCVDIRKRYTTRSISTAFSTATRTWDIVDERVSPPPQDFSCPC